MFREDLFQEICNHAIPKICADTIDLKFFMVVSLFYILKKKLSEKADLGEISMFFEQSISH